MKKKRKCPFQSYLVTTTIDGKHKNQLRKGNCPQTDSCQAWSEELGDCKLFPVTAERFIASTLLDIDKPDRYKEMWEEFKNIVAVHARRTRYCGLSNEMDRIETEIK